MTEAALGEVSSRAHLKYIQWLFALIPLWWILGVDFLMYFLIVVIAVGTVRMVPFGDLMSAALVTAIAVFLLRAYAALWEGVEVERVAAAIYNVMVLISGLAFYQFLCWPLRYSSQPFMEMSNIFFRSSVVLFWISLALSAFGFGLSFFFDEFNIPTLFGALVPGDWPGGIVKLSKEASFFKPDWLNPDSPLPRLHILGPYPNATAIAVCVLGHFAMLRYAIQGRRKMLAVVWLGTLAMVAFTLSRASAGGLLAGFLVAGLIFSRGPARIVLSFGMALVLLFILASIGWDVVGSSAGGLREGSTALRVGNYNAAVDVTMELHPFFGLGVKPYDENVEKIPLGSHSTVISSYVKGGILGILAMLTAFFVAPAIRWLEITARVLRLPDARMWRDYCWVLFELQITIWTWLLVEDVDAPITAAFLIFAAYALVSCSCFYLRRISP